MSDYERRLDFAGSLAELQALIGRRVSVESGPEQAGAFHESVGVLGPSVDPQLLVGWPLDRPARVSFFLDEGETQFVVRETGFREAFAYAIELPEGSSRAVQMHYAGGGVLVVRELID